MVQIRQSIFLILLVFLGVSCQTNNTDFEIPEGFRVVESNGEDNVLTVKYKNELLIVVSKQMSKLIKEGAYFGPGPMKRIFDPKFLLLLKKHNGINASELKNRKVNNNFYMYQSFDFINDNSEGYYEYGAIYIKEPEEYYELYISGDKSKQIQHKEVIDSFLSGIK